MRRIKIHAGASFRSMNAGHLSFHLTPTIHVAFLRGLKVTLHAFGVRLWVWAEMTKGSEDAE